jgi:hypothetical protein
MAGTGRGSAKVEATLSEPQLFVVDFREKVKYIRIVSGSNRAVVRVFVSDPVRRKSRL